MSILQNCDSFNQLFRINLLILGANKILFKVANLQPPLVILDINIFNARLGGCELQAVQTELIYTIDKAINWAKQARAAESLINTNLNIELKFRGSLLQQWSRVVTASTDCVHSRPRPRPV